MQQGPAVAASQQASGGAGAWICFQDEAGQTLRPPKAATWARRGRPVVVVSGMGSGRVSAAGIVCLKPGRRGRLVWAHEDPPRPARRTLQFSEYDYIALLDQVHHRLDRPIILVWDKPQHARQRAYARPDRRSGLADRDPVALVRPDLNPTEGVWSWMKHGLVNTAARSVDNLADLVRQRLRVAQLQPDLIAGFFAQTGMTLDPKPP